MMQRKLLLVPTLFLMLGCSITINAQEKLLGQYRNYFGDHMLLNADHTFKYTWHFDMQGSWTKGCWTRVGDTVFLNMVPVYDTLTNVSNGILKDSLLLSEDEIPERLKPITSIEQYLSSGGQNIRAYPDRLLFRKGRLYNIFRGQLVTKKQKGFWSKKRWPPYYFKSDY